MAGAAAAAGFAVEIFMEENEITPMTDRSGIS